MIVVKLGGSLYNEPKRLQNWLKKLDELSKHTPIVIVPGGGPFANQVRLAQTQHLLDDAHAHDMALLAMSQFGLLLHQFLPHSALITRWSGISSQLNIWLPEPISLSSEEINKNWDITSDSLALWLASQLGAEKLFIIKSCDIPNNAVGTLSELGILDIAFPKLFQASNIETQLFQADEILSFPHHGTLLS